MEYRWLCGCSVCICFYRDESTAVGIEKSKILYMRHVRKGSQVQFTNENFRPLHSSNMEEHRHYGAKEWRCKCGYFEAVLFYYLSHPNYRTQNTSLVKFKT